MMLNTSWWQLLLYTLIGLFLVRMCLKYLNLWKLLKDLKKKGAEVYFKPFIGITAKFNADTAKGDALTWFKESMKKNPKLRFFATHQFDKPVVYLVDPNLVKAFLSDPSTNTKASILAPYFPLLQHGLLFTHGNQWKKHRRTLSTIFRFEFIMSQLPTIVKTARHIFERELEAKGGKHIHILDVFQMITGELVFRIFFGEDLEGVTIDGVHPTTYLAELLEITAINSRAPENLLLGITGTKLGLFKRNRDYMKKSKRFVSFCSEMIQSKKKKLEKDGATSSDMLTLLLQEQKETGDFSDEEILHEFITFFFAGMDTTGHMLCMATYFFSTQNEEVQKAVMREANELSQAGINITSELLNKSEAIHAFFKESLRMATPAAFIFLRDVVKDFYLEDLHLKKGSKVSLAIVSKNYDPAIHPDPDRFNMNRWISGNPDFEGEALKNPFNFIPFSAGQRNCIGQHLAIIEGKIIWSILLSNYNFTVPSGYDMHYKFGALYEPRDILYLNVEKKKPELI